MIVDHEVEQGNDNEHGLSKHLWKETEQCALPGANWYQYYGNWTVPNLLKRPDLSVRARNPTSAVAVRDLVQKDLWAF